MSERRLRIAEKLLPAFEIPKRIKIIKGGRGSTKSMGVGDIMLNFAMEGEKIGCFREVQNSIDESVHALLKSEIERNGYEGFTWDKTSISHESGGGFVYRGLSRNSSSVKSMHGFRRFWVEEAQDLSAQSIEDLTPTLRMVEGAVDDAPELWMTLNPGKSTDPISERFIVPFLDHLERDGYYEDDLHLIIEINYLDNPWFEESGLEVERQWDYENKSRAKYDHIWLGKFSDSVDDAIIQPEWFDAAIDAHEKLGFKARGAKFVSFDPADTGKDSKGLSLRHGVVVCDVLETLSGDINTACDWATDYAIDQGADVFTYDGEGMGAGLRRQVNEAFSGKGIRIEVHHGSDGVRDPDKVYQGADDSVDESRPKTNKDVFKNRRAQDYTELKDRFYRTYRAVEHGDYHDPDTLISISSDIKLLHKLRSEVCSVPKKDNASGKIQIMNKAEMKRQRIPSPNLADALYMSFAARKSVKKKPQHIDIQFKQRVA